MPKNLEKQVLEVIEVIENVVSEVLPIFNFVLLVKNPFDKFTKGRFIIDPVEIDTVIKSGNSSNCLKVQRAHLSPNS